MSQMVLPDWLAWQPRAFPSANILVAKGERPALIDSGFVGHAKQTRRAAGAALNSIAQMSALEPEC